MKDKKFYNCIIYCSEKQINGKQFLKYHGIQEGRNFEKFLLFAAKFPGAEYVNVYDKATKAFKERIYLK